ncbi:MAG: archaetidylserine decarboxylase [Proteobacteria bacterium]|nr:archaetidylserine decarboxylase [Pseudomonadota bacterium]
MRNQVFNGLARLLPLNFASYTTGKLARWQLPEPVNHVLCRRFAKTFGIDLSEAEKPLQEYATIEELFTRRLKPGARPIEADLCSPADGILSVAGVTTANQQHQAKGLSYSLAELMFDDEIPPAINLAWSATIYLAPHNYHRVHSPIDAQLKHLRYVPGELWPVNKPSVRWTPQLFVRNERLVFDLETPDGHLYLAMVGALNVGRIATPFMEDFSTNHGRLRLSQQGSRAYELERSHRIVPGQELGTFMLGSTVIIAFDEALAKRYRMPQALSSRPVRMGESLLDKA